ncbi:MAG: iron chelate uptake ABC transporter family permease subunit [Planctomycetota bacterium]|nr:iron chelate uptake ABC transporter family permease subunit [Planctomycetota bacterium]
MNAARAGRPPGKRTRRGTAALIASLIVLSLVSLATGNAGFAFGDLWADASGLGDLLLISRIPRLVAVIVAGGGMCVAGMIMQTIARNRFVAPSTAGTVAWCKLGILAGTLLFVEAPLMARMAAAFLSSLAGTFIFVRILSRIRVRNIITVPLAGMVLGAVVESLNTFLATRYDLVQNMESWLQGSFALVVRGRYELLYAGIPVAAVTYLYANKFTIAGMGGDFARGLGLNHRQLTTLGLSLAALTTSVVTISVGAIPFIDLVIPNLAAIFRGDNLRSNLPDTALLGANFVLFCDLVSRLVMRPYEIPVGVTAGIIGGGVFLWLLARRNRLADS